MKIDRILTLILFFMFGFNLILPIFTKQESLSAFYGDITPADVSSYEWDPQEGRLNGRDNLIRVNNSEYYLFAFVGDSGSDGDGFVRTLHIWDNNGTIQQSVISSYEYDASDGFSACVAHISGTDKYILTYADRGSAISRMITLQVWDTNGTIRPSVIDTQALSYRGEFTQLLQVYTNVWAVAYSEYAVPTYDGFMETWWVDNTGIINNSQLDIEEFDTSYGLVTSLCMVDTDTIVLTYMATSSGGDFMLMTYNITTAGIITDTPADSWSYDANPYSYSYIRKVGANMFALTYVTTADDIYCKTVPISDAGDITASFTDTLLIYNAVEIEYLGLPFVIDDPLLYGDGVLGITCAGIGASELDGYVFTWNISDDGSLPASGFDSYEYETASQVEFANIVYVSADYYLIVYTGPDYDGWAKTIEIETRQAEEPKSQITITSGWFRFQNTSTSQVTIDSGWFRFQNSSFTQKTVDSGWFRFENTASQTTITSGWFRFYNSSLNMTTIDSGWFRFQNTSSTQVQTTGWFRFQNVSSQMPVTTGWFRFCNNSSQINIDSGWFRFQNTSSTQVVTTGWFRFQNISAQLPITTGWFRFQNISSQIPITTGWFRFQNISSQKTITAGWFRFQNISSQKTITSGWFRFSNISYQKTITSGWFRFANAIGIPCFTYTIEGAIIHLLSCSYTIFNTTIDGYLWEFSIDDGQTYSNTGWINDSSGAKYDYTYRNSGYVYVRLSCFVGNTTNISAPAERVIELGNNLDIYPPSYYIMCQDCLDAGYYWWDNSCHLTDEPLPWNEDRPLPDAGQPEPYTFKIGEWTVTPWQMLLVAGGIIIFLYLRHKQRKKIKKEIDKKWIENVEKK